MAENKNNMNTEETAQAEPRKKRKGLKIFIIILVVLAAGAFLAERCVHKIIPDMQYNKAAELMDSGDYEEAYGILASLDGYKDSRALMDTSLIGIDYNAAVALMKSGEYRAAYDAFGELLDFKDGAALREESKQGLLSSAQPGDTVLFGTYEQSKDPGDGKTDLEWTVLAKEDGKVLVISRYAVASLPYFASNVNTFWENCIPREWLNEAFINEAFSAEERDKIAVTAVTAVFNPEFRTYSGEDTEDQLFLLDISEAEQYFGSDAERECRPSGHAKTQGADIGEGGNCWWWLRSSGYFASYAAYVRDDGTINNFGDYVCTECGCIRPAMWINID